MTKKVVKPAALQGVHILAAGTTGGRFQADADLSIDKLLSGPRGGDAQLGAMIAEWQPDALVFFIDAMTAVPHDIDVKSLLRLAILYDTMVAVNQSSADAVLLALRKRELN